MGEKEFFRIVGKDVLMKICPEEETFHNFYLDNVEENAIKQIKEDKQKKFHGENFDADGLFQTAGIVISVIVYDAVKDIYKYYKDKAVKELTKIIDNVIEQAVEKNKKQLEISRKVKKYEEVEKLKKEIRDIVLKKVEEGEKNE